MKSILYFILLFSAVVVSAGTISGLSYNQNAFASSSPPVVSVTSPTNDASIASNTVTITGTASSSSNTILTVQVSIDGIPYVTATGTTSWSYTANGLAAGIHSITAKATDNQGLIGYSTNVVASSGIPVGTGGQELVFDPDNGNIYVANIGSQNVAVVSGSTNHLLTTIPDSYGGPTGIAYDSVNHYLYASNYGAGTVTVINTANNQIVGSPISVGVNPFGVGYVPNGDIYVANTGSNTISVIDPSTSTVVANIPVDAHPQDFTYDSTNNLLYMTNQGAKEVTVINPATNTVVGSPILVGDSPRGLAYDPANGMIYVANNGDNTVSIINTSTNTVVTTISTGSSGGPNGVAFDPVNGLVYVPDFSGTILNVIDSTTNTFINPVTLPSGAPYYYYTIFDPLNSDIYITSGNNVAIVQTQTEFTVSLASTSTSIMSSQNPSTFGQSVSFTATVTPSSATGNMVFTIDGVPQAPVAVSSGQAVLTSSSLSVGTHSITAAYSGDTNDASSASSTLTQTVTQLTTTTTLSSSLNSSTFGQSVTITAAVSPNTATGTVTFTVDGTPQTPVPVSSGQAVLTTSTLSVGTHTVTAAYSGDTSDLSSSSSSLTQTVNKIITATTLVSSASVLNLGQSVNFTATVSPTPTAGETVTFFNGTSSLGTGITNSTGQATFTTNTLSVGTHSIMASYPGDTNNVASTSTPITITVLSLLGEKQSVIPSLQSLTAVDRDDKQDLKQAIEAVQDSVDPSLWQSDGIHLVVKKGDKVFDDEQQAVQQLMGIINDKRESSSFNTIIQNEILELVGVDQGLAKTAIADALDLPPSGDSAKDIAQAQKIMTDASTDADKGQFAEAIQDYSEAWSIVENDNPHDHHFGGHCDYHDDYGNHNYDNDHH